MGKLLIYKASAGSGKTFTLAIEYIKHLILNPRAYRQILAVTFTNKATAEMKERILSQLYGISVADAGSEIYLKRIEEDLELPPDEIRKRAGTALTNMIHDYSRFRVETIDSFFQSVMRNLARELGLNPNLNVDLKNEEAVSEAVDAMMEKLTLNSPEMTSLLEYINDKIGEDKKWDVSNEIKQFGLNLFNEEYIEKGENLHQRLKDNPNLIANYRKTLKRLLDSAIKEMAEFADIFNEELQVNGLEPTDLKGGKNGVGSYFRKLANGELSNDIRNKTVEDCLSAPENWASKTSKKRDAIVGAAEKTLMPLLEEAEKNRLECNKTVNSCNASLQHLSKLQLLTAIDNELRNLNREKNRFLLSDTNALLHRLIGDGDSSFIFEKIGTNIRHVMIDEFQDTSRMQWGNFRLLLLEGLSQGADSLIVGDVKQAIYRWRNGDWGILNNLNDTIDNFPIDSRTLTTNRRSESNIIRFNNIFFPKAVEHLDARHIAELNVACESLTKAYQDVIQESPRTEDKGYVKISILDNIKGEEYIEETLAQMNDEVERLLEAGVKLNDIAILVRKKKFVPRIAEFFAKNSDYKIVSDEAFRLDASQVIDTIINALRYLSDSTDVISLAQLTNKIAGPDFSNESPTKILPKRFTDAISRLKLMPLYELLEELFDIFELEKIEEQDAYLFAFFDAVLEYLKDNSSGIDGFIEYWDNTLCRKTIPGGEIEGIRIFSVHKSKGLEFHTVLLPFCDWNLEVEKNNQLVWFKSPQNEEPYNSLDIIPLNYTQKIVESVYRESYLNERLQLWVDNLNILYVALTRAGKNLIIWSKKGNKGTIAEVLSDVLPSIAEELEIGWSTDEAFEFGEICPSEEKNDRKSTNKLLQKPEKLKVKMESERHDIKFRQSNRSADFIRGISEEESHLRLIDRGSLLHTLFSAISTEADIETAIEELVFEGVIGDKQTEEDIRSVVEKAFAHPQVKEWYSNNWKLFNECAIIYKEGEKTMVKRPDRVMTDDNRTVIIDFKFGQPHKRYEQQVKQYINLLERMDYQNIEGYLWYVEEELICKV